MVRLVDRIGAKARRALRRYRGDERGTVAIMFGLVLVPLVGMMGAAVDYGRAATARASLQAAVDAGALVVVKDILTLTDAQLRQRVTDAINANWQSRGNAELGNVSIVRSADRLRVSAEANLSTTFMGLLGINHMPVATVAEVGWGSNKIEIALVLDNTGSMGSSSRMTELKRALCGDTSCSSSNPATGFVRIMRDAAREDDQVKIGIVPFDVAVRMPLAMQQSVNSGTSTSTTFTASGNGYCSSNGTSARRISFFRFADKDKDTTASNRNSSNQSVGTGCGTGRAVPATWQGCVWDRDQADNRDSRDAISSLTDLAWLHPAVNCRSSSLARILPLREVRTQTAQIMSTLASMQPSGNTNITIGMAWGQAVVTSAAPFTEALPASNEVKKFIILMTDGDNTESKYASSSSTINTRTTAACNAAKAQDIAVYTIRVMEGNETLLRNCATSPTMYYNVTSAAQLTPVFAAIAGQIGAIRLTH